MAGLADSLKRGIIKRIHLPFNSFECPVKKPACFIVVYWCLNGNTDPLTAAVPNVANLTAMDSSTRSKRYVLYGSLTRGGQRGICFSLGRCIVSL